MGLNKNKGTKMENEIVNNLARVRVYPNDADGYFVGTVIEEKERFYVVVPDYNLQLSQNWNKSNCEVIG